MNEVASRFLRAASLVVTDRRWAAPLSAMALGFGLFVGVAIGPNAAGSLAGVSPILEIPSFGGGSSEGGGEGGGSSALPAEPAEGESGGGLGTFSSSPPLVSEPGGPTPAGEEPKPAPKRPAEEEEPESEEAQAFEGVVVHANPAAGSYALAIEGGELISVHAAKLPAPGTKLSLSLRRLGNDTFAEAEPGKSKGSAKRASFRGVVTFVDPDPLAPAYAISGRGTSILVRVHPDPAGAVPPLPGLGSYATVTAEIEAKPATAASSPIPASTEAPSPVPASVSPPPGCAPDPGLLSAKPFEPAAVLWQGRVEVDEGEPSTYVDLAGIVTAVCLETGQLLISADGIRESGSDLTLWVPSKIETGDLVIGDSVLATAEIGPDGALTLAGLASDEGRKGADDTSSAQGDLKRR